jgi:hypothetical protein
VDECREVYRLAIAECRLETNAFGNVPCLFVKPVAQPVDNADHLNLTAGEKTHLEGDLTLTPRRLRLRRIACLRLGGNNRWRE